MKNSILSIISISLLLILMLSSINKAYSKTDTIPAKHDTSSVGKTCIDCHGGLMAKKITHPSKTDKGCQDCHNKGDVEHPKTAISLINKISDLCYSCHDKKKQQIANAPFVHKVVNDKKSCTNCHSPHSADEKGLLVAKRKDLCLSCHNKAIAVSPTKTLPDIENLAKTSKTLHPPFKTCSKTCHNPHGSKDYRLLDLAFPVNNYLQVNVDSFGLCWECHEMDLVQAEKTTITNFRNGDKNLHYVHVHGEKGRSCTMCHSPHATNNAHLIKDKVGFGSWEFKMNYNANDAGGSCTPACHQERKYTR